MDKTGNAIRDTWDKAGKHIRGTRDKAGNILLDTWDKAGNHIHESWDKAGNSTRDTWDKAGNHIHESWDKAGNITRDTWGTAGNHIRDAWHKTGNATRDTWDIAGNHLRGIRGRDGNHIYRINDGIAQHTSTNSGRSNAPGGADLGGNSSNILGNLGAATLPSARPREPVFEGFNAAQQETLRKAYQNARRMIDEKLDKLVTHGPDRDFVRWFGAPEPENVEHVKQVLSKMQHALAHNQYTVTADSSPGSLAHVFRYRDGQIFISPSIFSDGYSHGYGPNTIEHTFVHELSHFSTIGNTADNTYGADHDQYLALDNAKAALNNADNYATFIAGG
ncbi:M35 family metallopeptidase [Paraburkholderia dinghuensis]|uniref:M35 family metallopeptidase n=1 Tax=Paraburkholderia dinghuensis TaxID=2305225 RepID=UPI001625EC4D|nr:M35 family metallo-endopeptidase [Paraburkholderia dinghuensis]